MSLDSWYDDGQLWHAHREGSTFWCGKRLLQLDEDRLVSATEDDAYPPTPCPSCLRATAMRDVVDEPLETAKGRGYIRADDS
jgi:hypothetical protein